MKISKKDNKSMDDLYSKILKKRRGDEALKKRLKLYSKLIYCAIHSESDETNDNILEVVNVLIRKSSELKHYKKTTDLIPVNNKTVADKHEHVIPCSCIRDHFMSTKIDIKKTITKDYIYFILLHYGIRAIINKKDNEEVDKMYKKTMPLGWKFPQKEIHNVSSLPNPLIRYKGIINKVKLRT